MIRQWCKRRESFFKSFGFFRGYFVSNKLYPKHKQIEEIAFFLPEASQLVHLRTNTSDVSTFTKIFIDKEYLFATNINPELIIDGGANIGLSALYFSIRFPKAHIITVEPEKLNTELLRKNLARRRAEHITAALWHRSTFLKFIDDTANTSGFRVIETDSGIGFIRALSLKEIFRSTGRNAIDLLKLDIEGAEVEVFSEGYEEWLPFTKMLIIETHDRFRENCTSTLMKAIKKYDFVQYKKGENLIFANNAYNVKVAV